MNFSNAHPISMKVMRLYQPLQTNASDTVLNSSLAPSGALLANDSFSTLQLPPGFGKICAGQSLSFYVSVKNYSQAPLQKVWVTGELVQTETEKCFPLADRRLLEKEDDGSPKQNDQQGFRDDGSRYVNRLEPGGHTDYIVTHMLKDTGPHYLLIKAGYCDLEGGPTRVYTRKYRFDVRNAFSLDYNVEQTMTNSDPYHTAATLDVTLQNKTEFNVCVKNISVVCAPLCKIHENQDEEDNPTEIRLYNSVLTSRKRIVQPGEVIKKFFIVQRQLVVPQGNKQELASLTTTEIGQLNIDWYTTLGESGRWTSPVIKSDKLIPGDCHLCVKCPSLADTGSTCVIEGTLTNTKRGKKQKSRNIVRVQPSKDVLLAGPVLSKAPELAPCDVHQFSLAAVPLQAGNHILTIEVYDDTKNTNMDSKCGLIESRDVPIIS